MKKMLFVINPRSGTQKGKKLLADILSIFNRAEYAVTIHITAGPGDCAQTVRTFAPDMDVVVCCGGDGTFNETVTGVIESGVDIPLGYIPAGSTNDFATSLNLPTDLLEAARTIVEGTDYVYDVGKLNDRYFTYVASFGLFTRTSYATNQTMKNLFGHAAYLLSSITEITRLHSIPMEVTVDGEVIQDNFLFGAVSNSTSVGGVLALDPHRVDMADGNLELLLIRPPKNPVELASCIHKLRTFQYDNRMITFRSAQRLQVKNQPGTVWTLDGERFDAPEHLEISNLHHAIRLLQKG